MTAYDADNIFAKILRGDIPSYKVYEDDDTLAFMDVMPQSDGHTLILPKTPARNILDVDPDVLAKVVKVTQKIAKAAVKAFEADGAVVMQYNEAPAGQTVFHLHFHVVPRYIGTPLRPHTGKMADGTLLASQAEKLKAALAE
ncbi:HIT family protein [Pleomorphomonas sp. JP5]|uniref:HIT family protein n=1 Tax=Pleomorphomonas sp. JP5 TaxID=2942998 RepID=UPI002042F832|nr:HIT family protein [Pleomorphomonas sp. JP5]MCM5560045.1 HIT family protein [Pleomorphomonas sp. JP5]